MKNTLSLHEAIVIALINIDKKTFAATFDEIAAHIDKRGLYSERRGNITLAKQVMLRSTKAKGAYSYLFHQIDDQTIQLKSYPPIKKKPTPIKAFMNGIDLSQYTEEKKTKAKLRENERILRRR